MKFRWILLGAILPAFGALSARHASADIISASASGPGGTVSDLQITTTFAANDSIEFAANYTSRAGIDFTLTVDGPGNYFVGVPFGSITNSTIGGFPSFYAYLVEAPAGSAFNQAGYEDNVFTTVNFLPNFQDITEVAFHGPPGLGVGETTSVDVGITVTASGTQTFQVVLTPVAVPEPSTLVLGLAGISVVLGRRARGARRRGR